METNTTTTTSKLHPALWVAAVAVTLFSLVGIGSMTGLLSAGSHEAAVPAASTPAAAVTPAQPPVAPVPPVTINQNVTVPAAPVAKVAAVTPKPRPAATTYSSKPRRNEDYRDDPVFTPQTVASTTCRNCGVVDSIRAVSESGEGSGIGAVAGGVLGGVIGNQIGHGDTRDVARIAGIIGGGLAGHQIEKSQRGHTYYDIVVRMDDGSTRRLRSESQPMWQIGDQVRVENGQLTGR